jgi:hypothetical protein
MSTITIRIFHNKSSPEYFKARDKIILSLQRCGIHHEWVNGFLVHGQTYDIFKIECNKESLIALALLEHFEIVE